MTLRLLIDMNLSPSWVEVLRGADFNAAHWCYIGAPNAPDSEIFACARENKYIVFTHDPDFGALLAATGAEAGQKTIWQSTDFNHHLPCREQL